jgi:hypothetical protein
MPLINQTFSQIITFERLSGATYFDATGTLQTAANNVPRFDYNPSTLAAQGLLIEEARTNFFTNASGTASGTIGTGTVSGPDNVNCRTFIPTAGAVSFPNITGPVQAFTLSLGQTVDWAWSGWFAAGPVGSFAIEPRLIFTISVNNATSFTYAELQIDTTNWTVRQKSLPAGLTEVSAPTITLFKTGLYRVTWVVRYTQDATGRNNVSAAIQARNTANSGTYTADGVSGFQYTLVQAETGSFVTSTIPTTTTALTRNADEASVNTLSPWYNQSAGTMFAEFSSFGTPANFPTVWQLDDGTQQNILTSYVFTNILGAAQRTLNVSQGDLNTVGAAINAANTTKMGYAYATNDSALSGNGSALTGLAIDNTVSIPTVTTLRLGIKVTPANMLNGYLRRIVYYPRRLSNAELQSITS